ncbi:MAG: hypothetical protein CL536_00870 [Alcaligenaceae bacterium]|nr:hypothetical protein [Alcaligenaceae bacterium]
MIEWLEQSDSMGFIGVISSCGRFRIRENAYAGFRWCLWDSHTDFKKRTSRPVGSPARTLESAKQMAERMVNQ